MEMMGTNDFMKHLFQVDFHLIAIFILAVPLALFALPIHWALLAVAVLPQGIILTRAGDLRRIKRPVAGYVFINQLLVGLVVISCWLGYSLLRRH